MASQILRVLLVEDSEFDAHLIQALLRKGGYEVACERVCTRPDFVNALNSQPWDIVIADYNLPEFNAPGALQALQETGLDLPFIVVSGGIGEDVAVAAMKAGAHDYVMKSNLARLLPAVARELREAANRHGKRLTEQALRESELRYRLLWETATDAIILIDTDSVIRFANPAVEEVFGYKPEEVVGQKLSLLQPENLRGAHLHGLKRYLETGQKVLNWRGTETIGRHKNGREVPIEVAFSDMELKGKKWFVGFIRDITERKRAELELLENQEQFRVAREIQQHLFPRAAPALPGFDIAGNSLPAQATGGDYFDYLGMLEGCLGAVIGDVTGHGVGPALLMAETRAYLRILARNRSDVGEILTQANRILAEDLGYERYVTLLLVRICPEQKTLAFANAGHTPGYVIDANGKIRASLKRCGIPLGIRPETIYQSSSQIQLQPGDVVLLLTDGFEEATGPDDSLLGIDAILDLVRAKRHLAAAEILRALYDRAASFTQGLDQADDLTALVIKVAESA